MHDVDATKINFNGMLEHYDEVTFQHPHIGFESISKNSALVAHLLHEAKKFTP